MVKQQEGKTITIFFKNTKKPIVEVSGCGQDIITDFYNNLNSTAEYIKLGNFIFSKERFDYAEIE